MCINTSDLPNDGVGVLPFPVPPFPFVKCPSMGADDVKALFKAAKAQRGGGSSLVGFRVLVGDACTWSFVKF